MSKQNCAGCILSLVLLSAMQATAELEQLTLGGELRILGEYYRNVDAPPDGGALRWPAAWLAGRAVGTGPGNGAGIVSPFRFDRRGNDLTAVTQWTRLRAAARFTGGVAALIELDSLRVWGDDFRSDYRTGADFRPDTAGDVGVYQALIEVDELLGLPLRARVGRQELVLAVAGWWALTTRVPRPRGGSRSTPCA